MFNLHSAWFLDGRTSILVVFKNNCCKETRGTKTPNRPTIPFQNAQVKVCIFLTAASRLKLQQAEPNDSTRQVGVSVNLIQSIRTIWFYSYSFCATK